MKTLLRDFYAIFISYSFSLLYLILKLCDKLRNGRGGKHEGCQLKDVNCRFGLLRLAARAASLLSVLAIRELCETHQKMREKAFERRKHNLFQGQEIASDYYVYESLVPDCSGS